VSGTEGAGARLDEARRAVRDRAWTKAYELLSALDAGTGLEAVDLERLAKAAYWRGDADRSISTRERAYAAFLERGDDDQAALCALTLRREYLSRLQDSVAAGWLTRAERLLDGRPDDTTAHGFLAITHADAARARGHFAQALALVDRALAIAEGSGNRDLHAWGVMRRGMFLIDEGRLEAGWPLVEEVAGAAAGGELGAFTTGAVFANAITMCRDVGDYRRGGEWADAAMRWCEREEIVGFPGICRLHRGEILRMVGRLSEAEGETSRAWEELAGFSPLHAAAAQHELGEVRLRLGDLGEAEEAFRQAHELGEDPQPGFALLRLARGKPEDASASIRGSLEGTAFDRFARAQLLSAQAEIAVAAGDTQVASAASDELSVIAGKVASPAIAAASEWARGLLALHEGDHAVATFHLRRALTGWEEIGAPYEAARAAAALAEAYLAEGDRGAAAAELESARGRLERMGARLQAQRVTELSARSSDAGRAVRTFLFTDIVGSTSLIEVIGDEAWTDLRRWHDQALRSRFAEHGGQEIDHAGDGFFLAFPDAASAVGCAIEIQRGLAEHRRTHGFAPHVRIGLHATEATQTGGGDYSGLGVHTAARIASLAGPGEILASAGTVSDLGDVRTSDRRTAELRGIAEPVDVVAVDWRPGPR
jgi:class 3 adenylate cyclase